MNPDLSVVSTEPGVTGFVLSAGEIRDLESLLAKSNKKSMKSVSKAGRGGETDRAKQDLLDHEVSVINEKRRLLIRLRKEIKSGAGKVCLELSRAETTRLVKLLIASIESNRAFLQRYYAKHGEDRDGDKSNSDILEAISRRQRLLKLFRTQPDQTHDRDFLR